MAAADAEIFRSIRLEALERHPEAFAASNKEEGAQDLSFFVDTLERNAVFGGYQQSTLLGTAGFYRHTRTKLSHKGVLWGMYVRDAARGSGLGRALLQCVEDHALGHVEMICLSVVTANERARRFYERAGYRCYGIEPRAFKIHGRYVDEALMYKVLK